MTLLSWCDEFVGDVLDHHGNSLKRTGEWDEVVDALRLALRLLDAEDFKR